MEETSFRKKIYTGTVWSLLDNCARQGITLLVFIILARLLEPKLFGLLAVSILVVQVFKNVAFDSIAIAIVRKEKPTDIDFTTGFWYCLGLSVPAFIILFILADYLENWISSPGLAKVIKATSFMILTSGLARMHEAMLTWQLNFKSLAIRSSISVIIGGIVGVFLAYKGYGIESLVSQQIVTSLTELLLLWIVTPWKPSLAFSKKSFYEITGYGRHVALTGITNFANQNSDLFFVTYYLGSLSAGFYSTGKRITNTLNFVISTALMRVSLPAFSRLQNKGSELKKTFLHSTALTAMVTAPLFVGLAALSTDITLLLLGEKWLGSAPIMQIVTIIGFLTSIGYYNQSIMLVKNKPQWQTRLTCLYAVTNILAFFIFTRFGLIYTALAFSLRALFLFPVSVWCAINLLKINWKTYLKGLLPALFSASAMLISILLVSQMLSQLPVILRLSILILIGIISYVIAIFFTMSIEYKAFVVDFLRKRGLSPSKLNSL